MNPLLSTPPPQGMKAMIEEAKTDLAQRLSISADDINLVEAKAVTWSDGSLGCPQPDMMYTQALVPGYLVILQFNERTYEYHGGRSGSLFFCENPVPPVRGTEDT